MFTFSDFKLSSPGAAPTSIEGVTNVDLVFVASAFTSVIATDSEATY